MKNSKESTESIEILNWVLLLSFDAKILFSCRCSRWLSPTLREHVGAIVYYDLGRKDFEVHLLDSINQLYKNQQNRFHDTWYFLVRKVARKIIEFYTFIVHRDLFTSLCLEYSLIRPLASFLSTCWEKLFLRCMTCEPAIQCRYINKNCFISTLICLRPSR